MQRPAEQRAPRVRIDLRATFLAFCELHGLHPVMHAGRLLFSDGWQHSSTDYRGPAFQPPEGAQELAKLKVAYWKRRRAIVRAELKRAAHAYEQLQAVKQAHPAAKQSVTFYDAEAKKLVTNVSDLDLEPARLRKEWLEEDVAKCTIRIAELATGTELTEAT